MNRFSFYLTSTVPLEFFRDTVKWISMVILKQLSIENQGARETHSLKNSINLGQFLFIP